MHLINGEMAELIAANDRGLQFGDGCFTTARIVAGEIRLLAQHLQRLKEACEKLGIAFTHWDKLADDMRQMAFGNALAVLKVVITRGSGGRGYSALGCQQPTSLISVSAYPAHYARWKETGITLALSPVPLGRNPYLAGIKHLNRLEQVLIRSHLEQTNADEALVLDSDGWLTECCAANLFWRRGQDVFTPRLDQAGVNGIMRQFILRALARSPYRVVEVNAPLEALMQVDEVVVCNALMPVVPVQRYAEHQWHDRELYQFLAPLCESSE